jgi:glutamate formiminotransferase
MEKVVECVTNFSEGRCKQVVDEIVSSMLLPGIKLLDREMVVEMRISGGSVD